MKQSLVRLGQIVFIVAAAAFAYSFVASAQDGELRKSCTSLCALGPNYAGDNRLAPDIELNDLNGAKMRLSDYRGKTVVLVFWTTTCDTCKQQMPDLAHLADVFREDPNFVMLTVAVDESAATVRKTVQFETKRQDEAFPVALDPDSKFVLDRFGTKKFPETWIVDPGGVIRARFDGPRPWASPLVIDVLRNASRGTACPLQVQGEMISGPGARVCRELRK